MKCNHNSLSEEASHLREQTSLRLELLHLLAQIRIAHICPCHIKELRCCWDTLELRERVDKFELFAHFEHFIPFFVSLFPTILDVGALQLQEVNSLSYHLDGFGGMALFVPLGVKQHVIEVVEAHSLHVLLLHLLILVPFFVLVLLGLLDEFGVAFADEVVEGFQHAAFFLTLPFHLLLHLRALHEPILLRILHTLLNRSRHRFQDQQGLSILALIGVVEAKVVLYLGGVEAIIELVL
mmetsp:Transcript_13840/g.13496  ORF Transcript_13840/g.13496 Transcript_13840/m.13496 type:complete len:238 (-) Transcript_13840:946-1659(-)